MKPRITRAATGLCAMIVFGATAMPVLAQGPVAAACQAEIAKFCAGLEHGQGAVRQCLETNKDKASAACKTALDTTGPGKGMGGGMGGGMGAGQGPGKAK